MRTKTIIAAAAILAVSMATTVAQTNVYSQNVVGYINVTVPANGFAAIANQLNAPLNNAISNVLANPPPGTLFYKWTGGGYSGYWFDEDDLKWYPNGAATLNPGEGALVKNPSPSTWTITFVGEVRQGSLTNAIPAGYWLMSSIVPQAGKITTDLGFPRAAGDVVYKWIGGGWRGFWFDEDDLVWLPTEPSFNVGESFMAKKVGATNWIRNFTVQ